jgi:hypothetical protein
MLSWILSVRGRWLMGRKLRGKQLREALDKNWISILTHDERGVELDPAPTAEEFRVAVGVHNAQYLPPQTQPTLWHGDRSGSVTQLESWTEQFNASHRFDAEQWRRQMHGGGYTSGYSSGTQSVPQTDWTCDAKDLTSCPVVGEPIVEVPRWMYEEWTALAGEVDTEWICYLVGEMKPAGAAIEAFYFPPQLASGAHVAQPDDSFRPQPRTIGATHSHVKMGAFWSKTDEDHANWPVEIVINAKGESKCRVRLQLECHRYARIDSKIKLTGSWQRPSTWRDALQAALEAGSKPQEAAVAQSASQAAAPATGSPIAATVQPDSIEMDAEMMEYYRQFGGGY